jgi:C2 domain
LQSKRTAQRVLDFHALTPDSKEDTSRIQLLVEIVSGIRLPIADGSASDPYVIVRMGAEEVHRTKPIHNT